MKLRTAAGQRGVWIFLLIWFGQVISMTGSSLTPFALGVWLYRQAGGTVTELTLIALCQLVPGIIMLPLAGTLVDRWDRRRTMILSDAGTALSTLALMILIFSGRSQLWQIYLFVTIGSIFSAFQWPAYSALISQLVPKEHLGRADGLRQFGYAITRIAAPLLAGALIEAINLGNIILIDFATFLFSITTLMLVRTPKTQRTEAVEAARGNLLQEATFGWHYIRTRPGLLGLLVIFAFSNFLLGLLSVLVTPLVLSIASATATGAVISIGGLGMLLGGLTMSIWGGPKRRVYGALSSAFIGGLFIIIGGSQPLVPLFMIAAFGFFFTAPIVNGCADAILQTKVAPDVQGRVFGISNVITAAGFPLSIVLAGPLVDRVFEPLLTVEGPLANSVGQIIGVGPGRGIGFLFIIAGAGLAILSLIGYLTPRIRYLDTELPDAIADDMTDQALAAGHDSARQQQAVEGLQ